MRFDLIVIGGGHNGLVCAALAAESGLSVGVIERNDQVGGAAVTEEFLPGFRNSAASYTVSLLDAGIVDGLGLRRHGLTIVPRPVDNFVPGNDGPGLFLPNDARERHDAIAAHSPADARAYRRFSGELSRVADVLRPLLAAAPIEPMLSFAEFKRSAGVVGRMLAGGPRSLAAFRRLFRRSAGAWLDEYFETDLLKGALGFDSIVGHFASPYSQGSAYLLLHHCLGQVDGRRGAWGHAIGGMGAISDALAAAAVERGVEIRTGESVERIRSQRDGFVVETSTGVHECRAAAGAIHPERLFLELLDGVDLPDPFRRRLLSWKSESASFRINVALGELPDFSCLPGTKVAPHHGAGILIAPSLTYLDQAFRTASASGISERPVIELVIPSVIDDTLAPPGRHVASLFCQHFRYDLPGGLSWEDMRDSVADRIVRTVDDYAPNFSKQVIGLRASSPVDLERRFGLVGGDIFHGAMTRDQLYERRPAKGFARYRTPVPNLYLCASGAHPGGGVSGLPGRNAARAIVEDWSNRPGD